MTLYGEDGRGVIRLGDSTDHGGEVISVSRTFTDMGKPVACVGDMVQCPKCKGTFPIAQGDSKKTHMGLPMAFHGDKTTCGATLISSWGIKGVSSASPAQLAESHPTTENKTYDQHFQLFDHGTQKPLANRPYKLKHSGGELEGVTDENGFTQKVQADTPEDIIFEIF